MSQEATLTGVIGSRYIYTCNGDGATDIQWNWNGSIYINSSISGIFYIPNVQVGSTLRSKLVITAAKADYNNTEVFCSVTFDSVMCTSRKSTFFVQGTLYLLRLNIIFCFIPLLK